MKKTLISKIALAIVLVSASTQAFGGSGNEWFKKHPVIKGGLVAAATLIPATVIPVGLTLWDIMVARQRVNTGMNLLTLLGKNCSIGVCAGFVSYLAAKNYPAEYCVATGLAGVSLASLCGFFFIPGIINK